MTRGSTSTAIRPPSRCGDRSAPAETPRTAVRRRREHHEDVVESFDLNDYLGVQEVVYRLGKALTETLPIERLYVMSLGSRQGNAHVHWHVVPLPPGVPYAQQQFNAVMLEHTGSLAVPEVEQADLAARLAAAMRIS